MRLGYASYPVHLPVRYQTLGGNSLKGEGRTVAISRETLHFLCDRTLSRNLTIQMVLGWPATLPDGTCLNLWIRGTITGSVAGRVEVRVGTYEFRTRRNLRSVNAAAGKNGTYVQSQTAGF